MAFIPMSPICTVPSVGQTMCLPFTDEETETEPHGCCLRTPPSYWQQADCYYIRNACNFYECSVPSYLSDPRRALTKHSSVYALTLSHKCGQGHLKESQCQHSVCISVLLMISFSARMVLINILPLILVEIKTWCLRAPQFSNTTDRIQAQTV